MNQPVIAANRPLKVTLEKDRKYYFCVCGKSAKQPFCDGSHQGSEFTPQAFECAESKDYYLCQCKQSANKPYCDGTHNNIDDDEVSQPAS